MNLDPTKEIFEILSLMEIAPSGRKGKGKASERSSVESMTKTVKTVLVQRQLGLRPL
jgi:hypothetical protein